VHVWVWVCLHVPMYMCVCLYRDWITLLFLAAFITQAIVICPCRAKTEPQAESHTCTHTHAHAFDFSCSILCLHSLSKTESGAIDFTVHRAIAIIVERQEPLCFVSARHGSS